MMLTSSFSYLCVEHCLSRHIPRRRRHPHPHLHSSRRLLALVSTRYFLAVMRAGHGG